MQVLIHRDSKAWQIQVWVSFLIAVFLCAVGLTAWGLPHNLADSPRAEAA